ncbi:jg21665 [Pararge aegeria aegeria]|uniref:Jg21665 protein n=1 Tax=Pararge aegeria aegeria TaxID=348720 RepID=A0A8S4RMM3_9NEOP|nr:jg21665 [Pararge aegeria aegeria]
MSSATRLVWAGVLLSLATAAAGIKCWQCGQYSDGVGSITPCNNRSAARLNQCPPDAKYCIVSTLAGHPFSLEMRLRIPSGNQLVVNWWTSNAFDNSYIFLHC